MTNILKKTAILTASVLFASIAFAQEESFDLSSQRSESQVVNPVPGKKVDHKGIIDALREGDAELAGVMMRRHLEHVERFRKEN